MAERQHRRRRFLVPAAAKVVLGPQTAALTKTQTGADDVVTVGRELRAAREKMGWTLEDLETSLKIRFSVLQAIEDARFDVLPGSTYGIGFVRAYARFLHLDAEDMVRRFKAEAGAFGTPAQLSFPSPEYESRLPRDIVIIASIIVAAFAYGGWYYTTASDRAPIPRVAAVPEQLAALASRPPESSPSQAEAAAVTGRAAPPEAIENSPPPANVVDPLANGPTALIGTPQTQTIVPPPVRVVEVPERPVMLPGGAPAPPAPSGRQTTSVRPGAPAPQPPVAAPRSQAQSGNAQRAPAPAPAAPPPVVPQPVAPVIAQAPPIVPQPAAPGVSAPRPAPPQGSGSGPPPPPSLIFGNPAITVATPAPTIAAVPRPAEPVVEPSSRLTLTPPSAPRAADAPAGGGPRIVIRATAEVWVEVKDQGGKPVFMKLMRRGDSYGVPNRSGLTLSAGRASAIAMTVDGEPVEVQRRSVALDADQLKQGAAARRNGG